MLLILVVIASTALQYVAALLALRLFRVAGKSPAWLLIAAVACLMALRRSSVLWQALWGDESDVPDPAQEWLSLLISVLMAVGVGGIGPFFRTVRRSEDELRHRTNELVDRAKELNCLYAISRLIERQEISLPGILQGAANLVPSAWQYPEATCARVTYADRRFQTTNFAETAWKQAADITARGAVVGQVEVYYLEEKPTCDEGPFRPNERRLLEAITGRLGKIIERTKTEEEKAALQAQLHQAQKVEALGQLACGVAHDFHNLLTVVLGHAAAARARLEAGHPADDAIETIQRAVDQAQGVTESLLRFSGKLPAEKRPVDLCAVVLESARLLRHTLPASIEMVVETPGQTPVWVNADSTQLQQVVLNLAINARDAMPDGGMLRLAVAAEPHPNADEPSDTSDRPAPTASLKVADTGVGMPSAVIERVFDPFFTTKPRGQGTGLGLSIVHGIVQDHGGDIEVESRVGVGSTFTVALPRIEPQTVAAPTADNRVTPEGHGELIVVAEDHELVRELIVSTLQSLGYEALAASDGIALLERYREQRGRIRVFILDLDLPRKSGMDCLREIRAGGDATPVIVITGRMDATLEDQLDGDSVLLSKPFSMNALTALVHGMLAAYEAEETPA